MFKEQVQLELLIELESWKGTSGTYVQCSETVGEELEFSVNAVRNVLASVSSSICGAIFSSLQSH